MKRAEHLARQAKKVAALEDLQRPKNITEESLLTFEADEIRREDELAAKRRAEALDLPDARPLNPGDPSDYVCWGHRWLGEPRIPGGPPTPCPHCRALTRPESDEEIAARIKLVEPDERKIRLTSHMDQRWADHQMKLDDTEPVHGSHAEQLAIERIDELRDQELRRKSHRGRVLFTRIEDGAHVEWRAVPYRDGSRWRERLVRVAPEPPSPYL